MGPTTPILQQVKASVLFWFQLQRPNVQHPRKHRNQVTKKTKKYKKQDNFWLLLTQII